MGSGTGSSAHVGQVVLVRLAGSDRLEVLTEGGEKGDKRRPRRQLKFAADALTLDPLQLASSDPLVTGPERVPDSLAVQVVPDPPRVCGSWLPSQGLHGHSWPCAAWDGRSLGTPHARENAGPGTNILILRKLRTSGNQTVLEQEARNWRETRFAFRRALSTASIGFNSGWRIAPLWFVSVTFADLRTRQQASKMHIRRFRVTANRHPKPPQPLNSPSRNENRPPVTGCSSGACD